MKKLIFATAITLATAGMASAETILLDFTLLNADDDRQIELSQAVIINTLTEEVCTVTGSGQMWNESGLAKNCELFQKSCPFVQDNILAALEATGHTWRPTVSESITDRTCGTANSALEK